MCSQGTIRPNMVNAVNRLWKEVELNGVKVKLKRSRLSTFSIL